MGVGNHLFEYQPDGNYYLHVYQNPRCKTLEELVRAYEATLDE